MNLIFSLIATLFSASLPYQFTYDGRVYEGFEGTIDGTMKVSVEKNADPGFDEEEYTVWFENVGDIPSAVLEDIYALKTVVKGHRPMLRGCLGDIDTFYEQYCHSLDTASVCFESLTGRATHKVFPYFDLVHGNGGTRLALGWAGTWRVRFSPVRGGVEVTAETNVGFRSVLLPGEKVRTGLVLTMDYKGREEHIGVNKWRAWYMQDILPKADSSGTDIKPFWTFNFAQDTGRPNCDGSTSETYFTWQRTLEALENHDLLPDFRWIDAGWYCNPDGKTSADSWWMVGSWTLDEEKWPGNTLRKSNDACHRLGLKTLLWFEPERVTMVDELVKNFGYDYSWASKPDMGWITSDIGNPDCYKWTLDRILGIMDSCGIDLYREDNNIDHNEKWAWLDARLQAACGLPRSGMTENRLIQAHYALWDSILEYCRLAGKCTFLDSCASGGGRNDIEAMKRGFPILRSDYDRTTVGMRLSQSSGFCKWIPFHGASTKDVENMLIKMVTPPDTYVTRASLLPVMNYNGPVSQDPCFDFEGMRSSIELWDSCKHLLTKDFYQLTAWHSPTDTGGWTAFAYNDPESGESILTAFRQETCPLADCKVSLPYAKAGWTYLISDDDSGRVWKASGRELRKGITLHLDEARSSLLWRIKHLE